MLNQVQHDVVLVLDVFVSAVVLRYVRCAHYSGIRLFFWLFQVYIAEFDYILYRGVLVVSDNSYSSIDFVWGLS